MKFVRALTIVLSGITVFCSDVAASELNDSIQAFYRGDYAIAEQGFSALLQQGSKDARIYYYRGLVQLRQGRRVQAAADFQLAADLEMQGGGADIGQTLERIQGQERLVLEKYRKLARLASRQRQQPVAPPPIFRFSDVEAPVVTLSQSRIPTHRRGSEIPAIRSVPPSLSAEKAIVMGEQGEDENSPAEPDSDGPTDASQPVGTGVAATATEEVDPMDLDDPFAEFADPDAEPASRPSGRGGTGKASNVIGGVFRALFRATVPEVNLRTVIPGGVAPMGPEEGFQGPNEGGFGEGGFDDPGFGDDSPDDDPFGDF